MDFNKLSYDELIKHAEEVLVAVRQRAYHEGYKQGRLDESLDELFAIASKPTTRDDVIEMAKEDVDMLTSDGYVGYKANWGPFSMNCVVKFIVNKEKRTVVALLYGYRTGRFYSRGIAKCAPDDCFNVHIGKAIALRRALGLDVPSEYLNAPQPTEVRVGDVVNGKSEKSFYKPSDRFTIRKTEGSRHFYKENPNDWIYPHQIGRVIDDSRD